MFIWIQSKNKGDLPDDHLLVSWCSINGMHWVKKSTKSPKSAGAWSIGQYSNCFLPFFSVSLTTEFSKRPSLNLLYVDQLYLVLYSDVPSIWKAPTFSLKKKSHKELFICDKRQNNDSQVFYITWDFMNRRQNTCLSKI